MKQYLGKHWRANEMLMEHHQTGKTTRLMWKLPFLGGVDQNRIRAEQIDGCVLALHVGSGC